MSPRDKIIGVGRAEIGERENPPNSNRTKYGVWYGMNGVPWCAIFVSYVFDRTGYPLGKIDSDKGFHYCPSAFNFWRRNQNLTSDPQTSDIALFDWRGNGICDHVGIFVRWIDQSAGIFESLEGNTSLNNQSNGGTVMLRRRNKGQVRAFVTPAVLGNPSILANDSMIKIGDRDSKVAQLQYLLHQLGHDLKIDGFFGPITERIVKSVQQQKNLLSTGVVDDGFLEILKGELEFKKLSVKKFQSGTFLKLGDFGAAVVELQTLLNAKSTTSPLKEDGYFGRMTLNRVKEFQKKEGIKVDGIVGPETFSRLMN